ncbi:hypothetical protein ACLI4Z_00885 [Natrialbaceae archaeon A-arb3/5]
MNAVPASSSPSPDAEKRARAIRGVAFAAALTPMLLLTVFTRDVVSVPLTLAAVSGGFLTGVVVSLGLRDVHYEGHSTVVTTIVALVSICVATVLLWLLLPDEHISTFIYATIAFIWGQSLTDVALHVIWPHVGSRTAAE